MAAVPSSGGEGRLAQAHRELVADRALQFDLPLAEVKPRPATPDWLRALLEFLGDIAPVLGWIFWAGVAAVVLLIAFALVRSLLGGRFERWRGALKLKSAEPAPPAEWRPTEAQARVLLADADRLAAEGRHAEAVHLLLLRSIEDIQSRRPRAVKPALTARDIAVLDELPKRARPAFRDIAMVVERSLFGTASVDAADFARCRAAYEAFALPAEWRA